jgi:hypothetical protein
VHESCCICNHDVALRSSDAFQGKERLRARQREGSLCITRYLIYGVRNTERLGINTNFDFSLDCRLGDKIDRAIHRDFKNRLSLLSLVTLSKQGDLNVMVSDF